MKWLLTLLLVLFLAISVARADGLSSETYCLALNLYHEARGEESSGIIAVGNVVLNRVESKRFPNAVCKVVKQGGQRRYKCQFSWFCDGHSDKAKDRQAWKEMVWLAKKLLGGGVADNTNGALFYHTNNVRPYWSVKMTPKVRLGVHIFY
ncbi:MAG: cell wall hydrolase [Planctomycetes bacterium]|nr:cell wall hydrolase [Planctomycetota bacterium]